MKIIKFFIDNCFHCNRIEEEFWKLADEYKDRGIAFGNRHVTFSSGVDDKYKLTIYPTVILFDGEGREVRRIEGVIPPKMLEEFVKGAVDEFGE